MTTSAEPSDIAARLRAAGCVFAEDEAALLVDAATGPELDLMVRRRAGGEPLEHVLGWAEFRGLRIVVEAGVFVPRRRTGLLVAEAVRLLRPGDTAVDLCCGSGAVGAALAAETTGVEVHAADVDDAAVRCARRNGLTAYQGDLYGALPARLRGRVAVLAVNAPYVPSDSIALMPPEARDHEPRVALDGGPDGVDVHRRVAADAPYWLTPDGALLIETSRLQAAATSTAMADVGLTPHVVTSADLDATVVVGTWA